jgi:hypothetical protein
MTAGPGRLYDLAKCMKKWLRYSLEWPTSGFHRGNDSGSWTGHG